MNQLYRSLTLTGGLAAALAGRIDGVRPPPAAAPHAVSAPVPSLGTSTTTLSVSGCDFTVTYTWSGFKGKAATATFGLYERKGTLDMSFNLMNIPDQPGKGGTVTHTFKLTAGATGGRTIVGRGSLVDSRNYQQVSGTSSTSSPVNSTCG